MKFIVLAFYLRLRIFAHHFVGCNSRSRQPIRRLCKAVENRLNRNYLPGSFSNTSILHLALLLIVTNIWTVQRTWFITVTTRTSNRCAVQTVVSWLAPHPLPKKIGAVEKLSKYLLVGQFWSRNAKSEAVNLGTKFKLWATIIFCVRNLQLSVGILSKIFSVCRKITASCPAYFFHLRHRCVQPQTWDHWTIVNTCATLDIIVNGVVWCFCCMKAQYMFFTAHVISLISDKSRLNILIVSGNHSEWVEFNVPPDTFRLVISGMAFSGIIAHIHNNGTRISIFTESLTFMKHKTKKMPET